MKINKSIIDIVAAASLISFVSISIYRSYYVGFGNTDDVTLRYVRDNESVNHVKLATEAIFVLMLPSVAGISWLVYRVSFLLRRDGFDFYKWRSLSVRLKLIIMTISAILYIALRYVINS